MTESEINDLVEQALKAREMAYAPYSDNFKVGAAVLTGNGKVFTGCNVENASFGATVCAERVAIFKAVSEGETRIKALAVVGQTDEPIPPCGICRQVASEFSGPTTKVIMANLKGQKIVSDMEAILPFSFKL